VLPDSASSVLIQPMQPLPEAKSGASPGQAPQDSGLQNSSAADSRHADRQEERSPEPSRADRAAAGVLIMWSDRPRALSQRERMWAAAVAAKLCSTLS
jgi:hypothetical protein